MGARGPKERKLHECKRGKKESGMGAKVREK